LSLVVVVVVLEHLRLLKAEAGVLVVLELERGYQ